MAYNAGAAGTLFHLNFKINTQERGFNLKFHMVGADYAAVTPNALILASYLRNVMPADSEVFYATVSNDNTKRDSRFLRPALGIGLVPAVVGPPAIPSVYDMPETAVLVRLENTEGDEVSRKINPIPDVQVSDAIFANAITEVVGTPAVPAVAGAPGAWAADFNKLLIAIVSITCYVKKNHAPGGAFSWAPWLNAYVLRTALKKGGRVFRS